MSRRPRSGLRSPSSPPDGGAGYGRVAVALAVAVLTFAVFAPSLWNGFVAWDDEFNFVRNPHYRGLGWAQLTWMFAEAPAWAGHWIPLTWVSFGLDYTLWGLDPFGYHLTNVILHAANAALFLLVAYRLLGSALPSLGEPWRILGASVAALFWALHPLRAESVAWATERRDVLSGLFYLLAVLAYLRMVDVGRRALWLTLSVACFALAMLSKSIVMTLPLILAVLDAYPLRRLPAAGGWTTPEARRVWAEKVPYLAIAAAGGLIALSVVSSAQQFSSAAEYPLVARVAVVVYNLAFYAWTTLVPLGLTHIHELPEPLRWWDAPFLPSALGVAAMTAAVVLARRVWPAGLALWATYVISVLPISGLVIHKNPQIVADRYSYLACLGFALLVGAGACMIGRAAASGAMRPGVVRLALAALTVWIAGLATLTWSQVQVWRDTRTLWTHAVDVNPACAFCANQLGQALHHAGASPQAVEHLARAVALKPDRMAYQRDLGVVLLWLGRPAEAIPHMQLAADRYPSDLDLRARRGIALLRDGRAKEAARYLADVARGRPDNRDALTALGTALLAAGRAAEAVEPLERAVALDAGASEPRVALARAYRALDRREAVAAQLEILRRLDPRLAEEALRR